MKLITRIILIFLFNILGLALAGYLVEGFHVENDLRGIILLGVVFTGLNIFVKPVIKVILSPLILLTLGLGLLLVNALILYILDLLSESLTIQGALPLLYATLIVSIVHFFAHLLKK